MNKTLRTKSSNNRIVNSLMVLALGVLTMSGCSQVNDLVNSNKATNSNTTANTNANSNVAANSNANANTSVIPTNSAANINNQSSNTATAPKEEVPLTEEAKVFKNNLEGKWKLTDSTEEVTFTEDKYEVKSGDKFYDKGSYRILDEKTVEINSVQLNRKWNATMKILDDGNKLDWKENNRGGFTLDRVKP